MMVFEVRLQHLPLTRLEIQSWYEVGRFSLFQRPGWGGGGGEKKKASQNVLTLEEESCKEFQQLQGQYYLK